MILSNYRVYVVVFLEEFLRHEQTKQIEESYFFDEYIRPIPENLSDLDVYTLMRTKKGADVHNMFKMWVHCYFNIISFMNLLCTRLYDAKADLGNDILMYGMNTEVLPYSTLKKCEFSRFKIPRQYQ